MNNLEQIVGRWDRLISEEWLGEIAPDQKTWLINKIFYQARKTAARSLVYYLEYPKGREPALNQALVYRDFSDGYMDDKTDVDAVTKDITKKILGIGDETATIEKPEWMTVEDWEEAQEDALQDSEGNLLQPQLEGFLDGARYDWPSVYPSEHDEDNARKLVTNCMQAVLYQCQMSVRNCTKWLRRANSSKFKAQWENASYAAIENRDATQKFIDAHELYYPAED